MIKVVSSIEEHIVLASEQGFKASKQLDNWAGDLWNNFHDPMVDVFTLFKEDKIIAFAGYNHRRAGVAEGWIVRGCKIVWPFSYYKTVKRHMDKFMKDNNLHRMEIALDLDSDFNFSKWASTLGFEFEGVAVAYDALRRNHAIYARVI